MNQRILFLQGINNNSQATVAIDSQGNYQLLLDGGTNTLGFLREDGWNIQTFVLAPKQQQTEFEFPKPDVIFNDISDPDSHSIALKKAQQVRNIFADVPCINEPTAVELCSREKVSRKLNGIPGLVVPKTIRTNIGKVTDVVREWEGQFDGPVLLRRAGVHGGRSTILLRNRDDLEQLEAIALDGGVFYMTEYVDFKSPDDIYRKYRIVLVGDQVLLRSLNVSDEWEVNFPASKRFWEKNPDFRDQLNFEHTSFDEQLKPEVEDRCRLVSQRIGLDYVGVDCGLLPDGRLLIFEVNANMNIMINSPPKPNVWEALIRKIRDALNELIRKKGSVPRMQE